MMDPNDFEEMVRDQVVVRFAKHHIYEGYKSLCDKHEVVPVTEEALVGMYVNILVHQPSYREQAEVHAISDKEYLVDLLERSRAPVESILEVDKLPPAEYVTVNNLKDGVICLVILFIDKNTIIAPAHFSAGDEDVDFPDEIFS